MDTLNIADDKSSVDVYFDKVLEKASTEAFIGNLLLRHMCQLVCNAHAITAVQVKAIFYQV